MAPAPLRAAALRQQAADYCAASYPSLVRWRRDLHRHPEPGWMEYRTSYLVGSELSALGMRVFRGKEAVSPGARLGLPPSPQLGAAEAAAAADGVDDDWLAAMHSGLTGVVAQLDTGSTGPHTAIRVDLDALKIAESTDQDHRPAAEGFRSARDGIMHACGHDGHAAIGVALARFLAQSKPALAGRFTLLFQPAEEGGRGGRAMTEAGWLDDADYLLAIHLGLGADRAGQLIAGARDFLATTKLDAMFHGRAAHAGRDPQAGSNALLAAATAALHLHAIARHGEGATRINVGRLEAGTARNIIAPTAFLALETRGATSDLDEYMADNARRIIGAAAGFHDVTADVSVAGQALSAHSDQELADLIVAASSGARHVTAAIPSCPLGASEDASFMMRRVQAHGGQAAYLIAGSPTYGGHHNPAFDFDERAMLTGLEALLQAVIHIHGRDPTGN